MTRSWQIIILLATMTLATGCASGPKFKEVSSSIPPASEDQARIYLYRTAVVGAAVQPSIRVNGETVGSARPKGFLFVDRAPGEYQIETSTEVKRRLSLTLERGETRYVRLDIGMGFFVGHVFPVLVENSVGEKELEKCSYIGPTLPGVRP